MMEMKKKIRRIAAQQPQDFCREFRAELKMSNKPNLEYNWANKPNLICKLIVYA
jgi:hypothetical protein